MSETFLFTYAAACGFVVAAVLATGYQLVANRPVRFEMIVENAQTSVVKAFFRVALVIWAAPYIIMRNAVRGRLMEQRSYGWLVGSFVVAGLWSVCVGIMVLHVAVVLR